MLYEIVKADSHAHIKQTCSRTVQCASVAILHADLFLHNILNGMCGQNELHSKTLCKYEAHRISMGLLLTYEFGFTGNMWPFILNASCSTQKFSSQQFFTYPAELLL